MYIVTFFFQIYWFISIIIILCSEKHYFEHIVFLVSQLSLNAKGKSENFRPQARRMRVSPGQRVNSEASGQDKLWHPGGHNFYTVICCQSEEYLWIK